MKQWHDDSTRAYALQATLSGAVLILLAILFGFAFAAGPVPANLHFSASPVNPLTPPPPSCIDNWMAASTANAPSGRSAHTSIWTGTEMIVWGGFDINYNLLNTGARYNPVTDGWTSVSAIGAPAGRGFHTAVWTGSEMIIWGGSGYGFPGINTGARYNPITNSWTPTSTVNAPSARGLHTAVWTGSEMIVWGGDGIPPSSDPVSTGGRYNPATDSWTPINNSGAPTARGNHAAVWTGSEMIVWGGSTLLGSTNTGARYNPTSNTWTPTSTFNVATRTLHTAVWTGSEMIVWGGAEGGNYSNTGARYNPNTNGWTTLSTLGAPEARYDHTAIWTGSEMIVWGGINPPNFFNTGGRYNPTSNDWQHLLAATAPIARWSHTAVWDGTEMIVWGGTADNGVPTPTPPSVARPNTQPAAQYRLNTGGRYCGAASPSPTASPTPTASTPTPTPTATPTPGSTPVVSAPTFTMSVADGFIVQDQPVTTTFVDPSLNYVAFQADMIYDAAIAAPTPGGAAVVPAGITANGWVVQSNIINSGPGTLRKLTVFGYSVDNVTPLNGAGALFLIHWKRVSSTVGATTSLTWAPFPNDFEFIDIDFEQISPPQNNGMITIVGATPTPGPPTPTPTPAPPTPTPPWGLAFSPNSHDFGSVTVGASSTERQFFLVCGAFSSGCPNISVSLTGPDATNYSITSDNCSGHTLGFSEACSMRVQFNPLTTGPRSASLAGSAACACPPQNPTFASLTGTGVPPSSPTPTPYGKIVFSRPPGTIVDPTPTPSEAGNQLFSMNSNGTNLQQLTFDDSQHGSRTSPKWSYDGTKIVFLERRLNSFPPPFSYFIKVIGGPNSGLAITGASPSSEAAWSPDGTKIVFTSNGAIYVVNEDGSNLTNLNQFGTHPSWSPNGTKIAFGSGGVWVMNPDGSNPVNLTNNQNDGRPSWSADGTKIVFNRASGIWVMNADGSNQTDLNRTGGHASWSPDRSKIAFQRGSQIYTIDADGSNELLISDTTYANVDPDWQWNLIVPTPTPTPVSISGTIQYCSNPTPVPNVTLTLTGTISSSTMSNSSGAYQLSPVPYGGSYTVTPTKSALSSGSSGISTVDVLAVQRHVLNISFLTGCQLSAGDVNGDNLISTVDVIAIQRFVLGMTTSIANVGKYRFSPVSRNYSPLLINQTGQDYDTLIFGDVVSPFVSP